MSPVHHNCSSQGPPQYPSDLYLEIVTGGVEPWESSENIYIWADGRGVFEKWPRQLSTDPDQRIEFSVSPDALNKIWIIIRESNLFSLDSSYVDNQVRGGSYAGIFVKYKDLSHSVRTQNVHLPIFQSLIMTINEIIPEKYSLHYSIPEK